MGIDLLTVKPFEIYSIRPLQRTIASPSGSQIATGTNAVFAQHTSSEHVSRNGALKRSKKTSGGQS
jgi:hypothetical protein